MLKKGRFFAPPRASRITTMLIPLRYRDASREKPRIINSVDVRVPPSPVVTEIVIRPSNGADLDAITRIYAWSVKNGSGTFEMEPPDRLEIERRRADVLARGWPWLVLEHAGAVAGYAYASPFRPRPAYRFCLEDSVYLAPESVGRGFGRTAPGRAWSPAAKPGRGRGRCWR
jgi:hypothetical protein